MTNRINVNVTVTDITEFARENFHIPSRYDDGGIWEKFVCVTMRAEDGRLFKNFSKFNREFASSVRVGQSFTLSAQEGEFRVYESEAYTQVTYCTKGLTKAELADQKKAAKKAARLAKLGLTA